MANSESLFYKDVETTPIEGEKLSSDEHKQPFNAELGPMATSSKRTKLPPTENHMEIIHRKNSGRTLTEKTTRDSVIWGGQYEVDIFGSRDLKGVRHNKPVICPIPYAPDGIGVRGLWDNVAVGYVDMISDYLRSNGLPTEHPIATSELKEILLEGKKVPIDEWKEWALQEYISRDPENVEGIEKVKKYLAETKFYTLERELQTAERLRDIGTCQNKEDFTNVMGPALHWVNVATAIKNNGIIPETETPARFEIDNKEDMTRYLSEWIPTQMGTYLGRFSKMGFVNHYPHAQNWSCAGTMYDLDSVKGKAFGATIDNATFQKDVQTTLGALEELLNPDGGNYISREYPDLILIAKANFIKAYVKEREFEGKPNYGYFMNNTYYDGINLHDRFTTPEEWEKILHLMGYETNDMERVRYRTKYNTVMAKHNKS